MAIERQYTITCDQCGWATTQEGEHYDNDWLELCRGWTTRDREHKWEEFHLCSDECAAAFDPSTHREYT